MRFLEIGPGGGAEAVDHLTAGTAIDFWIFISLPFV